MSIRDLKRKITRYVATPAKFDARGKLVKRGTCSDRPPRKRRKARGDVFGWQRR